MDFDRKAFSNILKTLCWCHDRTITSFAKKISVNRIYIANYVYDTMDTPPSPKILRKIANGSDNLFTYLELMYICGYFTPEEYNILERRVEK